VSVIGTAAENLADGLVTDPDRVKRYGTRIQTEARRLGATVERVLLYAGIEAGRAVGHLTPVEVGTVVGDALAASHPAIADAGATVETDVPAGIPPVLADATALRSCVANLIANAIKYGGSNRWVGISATTGLSGGRPEVQLAVADRGLGIPASDLPHIFEPFYRGSEAQSRQIHGNGLGLSIVKGIVEAHGGRVSVQSAAGSGSTFVLHLPVYEASQPSSVMSQLGATARRA
jgi:signal transduction histidine kinase